MFSQPRSFRRRVSPQPVAGEVDVVHLRLVDADVYTDWESVYRDKHVNSQPFLRQPVTRWISPVECQAHLLRRQARVGVPAGRARPGPLCLLHKGYASGNLHRASPTGRTFACRVRT
jgi:hypothetical protein